MTEKGARTRLLCVDDEPEILAGLQLHLRRHFDVSVASSGAAGLELLAKEPFAVVLSDMRMPQMNGAAFLSHVRERAPQTVRILLTGGSDLADAISAVNDGQIFRFLSKPCSPPDLLRALQAAAEQHRLVGAERVLLEQTLRGSIRVLTDLLALVQPAAFGRATRAQTLLSQVCEKLGVVDRWELAGARTSTIRRSSRPWARCSARAVQAQSARFGCAISPSAWSSLRTCAPRRGCCSSPAGTR